MAKVLMNVRLSLEIKAVLAALARREHRSMTREVEALVIERAKVIGVLPQDWTPPSP